MFGANLASQFKQIDAGSDFLTNGAIRDEFREHHEHQSIKSNKFNNHGRN